MERGRGNGGGRGKGFVCICSALLCVLLALGLRSYVRLGMYILLAPAVASPEKLGVFLLYIVLFLKQTRAKTTTMASIVRTHDYSYCYVSTGDRVTLLLPSSMTEAFVAFVAMETLRMG